jgi:hypothetical protein
MMNPANPVNFHIGQAILASGRGKVKRQKDLDS